MDAIREVSHDAPSSEREDAGRRGGHGWMDAAAAHRNHTTVLFTARRQSEPSSSHVNQSSHSSEPSGSTIRAWNMPSTSITTTCDGIQLGGLSSFTATSTSIHSPSRGHTHPAGGRGRAGGCGGGSAAFRFFAVDPVSSPAIVPPAALATSRPSAVRLYFAPS